MCCLSVGFSSFWESFCVCRRIRPRSSAAVRFSRSSWRWSQYLSRIFLISRCRASRSAATACRVRARPSAISASSLACCLSAKVFFAFGTSKNEAITSLAISAVICSICPL